LLIGDDAHGENSPMISRIKFVVVPHAYGSPCQWRGEVSLRDSDLITPTRFTVEILAALGYAWRLDEVRWME
jgi:hypothetical protein